jgi:hypothetical protein
LRIADIICAMSDELSFKIFTSIANAHSKEDANKNGNKCNGEELAEYKVKLTKRQFNYRLSNLIDSGLVIRDGRTHILSSLGKIVYHYTQNMLEIAMDNQWRLKAIDLIEIYSDSVGISNYECNRIVDNIIINNNIKHVVCKTNYSSNIRKDLIRINQKEQQDEGQIKEKQQRFPLQEIRELFDK